jgi:hypothetical protein
LANTLTTYFTDLFSSNNPTQPIPNIHTSPTPPPDSHNSIPSESANDIASDNNSHTQPPNIHLLGQGDTRQQQTEDLHRHARFLYTNSTPSINEIHDIIKNMRSNAAPGPDGLNAAFYKASWPWVKHDIYKVITDFYSNASLPHDLNQTFISLIPKKNQPIIPQDYRPIGLCNVIYKIISKSVANRVKDHLPEYINHAQSAFIANRHISSNIIIT